MRAYWVFAAFLVLAGYASGLSMGASHSSLDFEAEPGETATADFWVTFQDVPENSSVDLNASYTPYSSSMVFNDLTDRPSKVSGDDISSWISFEVPEVGKNVSVSPENTDKSYNGHAVLRLDIPGDAEPGLRHGSVELQPVVERDDEGGVAAFQTGQSFPLTLMVDSNDPVQRSVVVRNYRGLWLDEDSASVELLLKNTGTVTVNTKDFRVDIRDSRGVKQGSVLVNGVELRPGEQKWVAGSWGGEQLERGSYSVEGDVNYFTGMATAKGSFSLSDIITIEEAPSDSPVTPDEEGSGGGLPLWLVAMVLVLLSVLMWSFDIQPIWIMMIVGFLGVAAFLYSSGVSNIVLLVLTLASAVVGYMVIT